MCRAYYVVNEAIDPFLDMCFDTFTFGLHRSVLILYSMATNNKMIETTTVGTTCLI